MLKSLLVYDDTGVILVHMGGKYRIPQGGIQYIEVEHRENQRPVSVDVQNKRVIFEDLPKTENEILMEKIEMLEKSNLELMEIISNK